MIFEVTKEAMRAESKEAKCFYCGRPVGSIHREDCVLIAKKVKVRMIVEYEISVPRFWDKEDIEFHRNKSSWCSSNALDELVGIEKERGCLCEVTTWECIDDNLGPSFRKGKLGKGKVRFDNKGKPFLDLWEEE